MEANELMIGNWVKFTSKYGYGTGQVVGIDPMEGTADPTTFTIWKKDKEGNTKFFVGVSKNSVEPIPLTPEILEKNGFVKSEYHAVWKIICDDYEMRVTPWRFAVIFLEDGADKEEYSMPCPNFVHELQHCLKLVGLKKEIVL